MILVDPIKQFSLNTSFSFFPWLNSLPKNDSASLFTLMAIDPDVPSQNNSIYFEFLHWLVVNIPDEDIERGTPTWMGTCYRLEIAIKCL